jgi:hypothetical protein
VRKSLQKIFLISSFLFIAINVFADAELCPWIGRGTVYFKELSGTICDRISNGVTMKDFKNGRRSIGMDCLYNTEEDFKVGIRLACLDGGLKYKKFTIEKESKKDVKLEGSYEASSFFMMYGGSYSKKISKKLNLNGKLFFGVNFINFKSEQSVFVENKNIDTKKVNEDVVCFVSDFSIGAECLFMKRFGLGFDVGYRFTPEVVPSKDIKIDFSGFVYNLGISYKL